MPEGWYGPICCICFETLTPEDAAVEKGQKWDAHKGVCAQQAGIEEDGPPENAEKAPALD